MSQITNKRMLASNLRQMEIKFPRQYDFFPRTWNLPNESKKFFSYVAGSKVSYFCISE